MVQLNMDQSSKKPKPETELLHYKLYELEDEIHLIPAEDTLEHTQEKGCICVPLLDDEIQGLEDADYVNKTIYLHQDAFLRTLH